MRTTSRLLTRRACAFRGDLAHSGRPHSERRRAPSTPEEATREGPDGRRIQHGDLARDEPRRRDGDGRRLADRLHRAAWCPPPLDTDLVRVESVCHERGRPATDQVLVLPGIPFRLNLHHFDVPGTLHAEPQHFIDFCVDVLEGVSCHGIPRMAVVNGHGSNLSMADLIARRIVPETPSIGSVFGYYTVSHQATLDLLGPGVFAQADRWRDLAPPPLGARAGAGGQGAGGRRPRQQDPDLRQHHQDAVQRRLGGAGRGSACTATPFQATPEQGKPILEPVMPEMLVRLNESRVWPVDKRQDQPRRPVQRDIRG